jgi:outer membrane biosynthesis protein TonB
MVVMAVTDAEPLHRAAPLWVKVLLAAGFAVAGWLVAGLLGGLTASADEIPQDDQPLPAKHHEHAPAQGGLLGGLVGTTVTTLVGTVDQVTTTVTTTVSTVTTTVDTLTTAVVQPVTSTLVAPITTAPKQHETTVTKPQTRMETVPQQAAPAVTPAPLPAPAPAVPGTAQQPVKHKQLPSPRVTPKTQQPVSEHLVQAKSSRPGPAPSAPDDQLCSAVAAHDGGGNTKHPLAILGARTGVAQLASIGVPRRPTQVDNSRDAALPTTSPD